MAVISAGAERPQEALTLGDAGRGRARRASSSPAEGYSTRRSCDVGMAGGEGESSSAPSQGFMENHAFLITILITRHVPEA